METVIKSLLGKKTDDYSQYLDLLLDPEKRVLLSPQEEGVFRFLKESYENASQIPTEEYFLVKFPIYEGVLAKAKSLNPVDLRVYYYNLMKKRANQNASKELMKVAAEVSRSGLTYEQLDKVRSYLNVVDDEEVRDMTESPDNFREFYERKKTQPTGLQTFVKEVDEKIGGISGGMLMVLGGFVGSYKTTFGLNMAYNNAKKLNYNLCYISLEVPKEEVMFNLLSRHSFDSKFTEFPYVSHNKMKQCTMTPEEEKFVMGTVLNDFYTVGGQIKLLDETDFKTFSMSEIREKLEAIDDEMKEKTGYPLDGVFWDHANLFKFNGSDKKKQTDGAEGNEYVSFIRKLAISFRKDKETNTKRKLSMVILAQVNRDGWKRAVKNKGRYDLRALAEINELERAGQVICTIFTDEAMKTSKEATMQLLKNRNGVTNIDPITIFVDPEAYVAGEEMEGFSEMLNMNDLESVLNEGNSIVDLF